MREKQGCPGSSPQLLPPRKQKLTDSTPKHFSMVQFLSAPIMPIGTDSPWLAPSLHVVGQSDVVGPNVVLPLAQAQYSTQHSPAVYAHSHVQVHVRRFHYRSVKKTSFSFTFFYLELNYLLQ